MSTDEEGGGRRPGRSPGLVPGLTAEREAELRELADSAQRLYDDSGGRTLNGWLLAYSRDVPDLLAALAAARARNAELEGLLRRCHDELVAPAECHATDRPGHWDRRAIVALCDSMCRALGCDDAGGGEE